MQNIILTKKIDEPFYCPICGAETISPEEPIEINECDHLLYVGLNETESFLYLSEEHEDKIEKAITEDGSFEDDLIALDFNDGMHFSLCEPAPSSVGVFVGFYSHNK